MIRGKTVLAVIPARGGSKRCPGKNIRSFRGKPLIQWTIEAAKSSSYIDTLVVSSDDTETLALGVLHGAESLERPDYLSGDTAKIEDVVRHVLAMRPHDYVILLQPTSPYRIGADINLCLEMAFDEDKTVVSYSESLTKHGGKNGAVYIASAEWIKTHDFSDPDHVHYMMSNERSLDIDYEEDFNR